MERILNLSERAGATRLRRLRQASLLEGTTLLVLLLVAVPLKHLAGWDGAVKLMGPLHGLAFLCYAWLAVQLVAEADGRWTDTARLIGLAVVPFGGFVGAARLARRAAAPDTGERA